MNPLIKQQLLECKHAIVPEFNEDTTVLYFNKGNIIKELTLQKDHYYLIQIADNIINPPEGFTLSQNWNGGTNPPTQFMNVMVVQVMGKMFKVSGVGFDPDTNNTLACEWTGWIPGTSLKIIRELI